MTTRYQMLRLPQTLRFDVRGVSHHCSRWAGNRQATGSPPVLLLHGYLDCGATFQFVADALEPSRTLLAPDWRGFGDTEWSPQGYWFPDYFADLEAIIDRVAPGQPVDIVGHSMGGNIAMMYAGIRPERVRRLVSLEGFGLPGASPERAPGRYREWLDQWRTPPSASEFPSLEAFTAVLRQRDPKLPPERADFVARVWCEILSDGRVRPRFDPAHKRVNPVLYRREEAAACWAAIRAPVLYVAGAESNFLARLQGGGDPDRMREWVPHLEPRIVAAAGHMLHHHQPAAVARLIEEFLVP
jgi:pimeloyl-ACP methyl ester carboxylesterase